MDTEHRYVLDNRIRVSYIRTIRVLYFSICACLNFARTYMQMFILLLEIFTRTYTDINKYWNYLLMFSFVHN